MLPARQEQMIELAERAARPSLQNLEADGIADTVAVEVS